MPTTATNIINQALDRLGIPIITTLGTDGTPQDDFMNRNYVAFWKEVMRDAGVNATRTRTELHYTSMALTLSSGAVGTGVTATAASAFFSSRDVGAELIEIGTGATGRATITAYTSPTVVTVENTVVWVDSTPAADVWALVPLGAQFAYTYELPSDFVRAIEVSGGDAYGIEGQRLLTDASDAVLAYWRYEDDPDIWESQIREAIIAKLAAEAAWPLTKDLQLMAAMETKYVAKLK